MTRHPRLCQMVSSTAPMATASAAPTAMPPPNQALPVLRTATSATPPPAVACGAHSDPEGAKKGAKRSRGIGGSTKGVKRPSSGGNWGTVGSSGSDSAPGAPSHSQPLSAVAAERATWAPRPAARHAASSALPTWSARAPAHPLSCARVGIESE